MAREQEVRYRTGVTWLLVPSYALAWVCTRCAAVLPCAVGRGCMTGDPQPLYRKGERSPRK